MFAWLASRLPLKECASDATPFAKDHRFWIFLSITVTECGGSGEDIPLDVAHVVRQLTRSPPRCRACGHTRSKQQETQSQPWANEPCTELVRACHSSFSPYVRAHTTKVNRSMWCFIMNFGRAARAHTHCHLRCGMKNQTHLTRLRLSFKTLPRTAVRSACVLSRRRPIIPTLRCTQAGRRLGASHVSALSLLSTSRRPPLFHLPSYLLLLDGLEGGILGAV